MDGVHFWHHKTPPTWTEVEPAKVGLQGQHQTIYASDPQPPVRGPTDLLIGTSAHAPQQLTVTFTEMDTVSPWPSWAAAPLSLS
ncbi:hypothetical protein TNCV_3276271 [Trichonephila clavipes]|nr:hypothetical protein TNCV_3276271 [Trichonephila clavipes]